MRLNGRARAKSTAPLKTRSKKGGKLGGTIGEQGNFFWSIRPRFPIKANCGRSIMSVDYTHTTYSANNTLFSMRQSTSLKPFLSYVLATELLADNFIIRLSQILLSPHTHANTHHNTLLLRAMVLENTMKENKIKYFWSISSQLQRKYQEEKCFATVLQHVHNICWS